MCRAHCVGAQVPMLMGIQLVTAVLLFYVPTAAHPQVFIVVQQGFLVFFPPPQLTAR